MSILPATFFTATSAFPCARSKSSTCSAEFPSPRARTLKVMPCAPCMPAAEPRTTTSKPATRPIGRRSTHSGKILVGDQLYVTGGVGARETGEAFGDPYELPNARAYGESCAAIGVMMWNWRMLAASGDARFTDVIERSLYNGINSGMSLDGRTYCYRNPLAFDPEGDSSDRHAPEGKIRNPWYDTTCCPPNLERTFASLPGYFYGTSDEGVYVHLYDNSTINWRLHDGRPFRITQATHYPWEGNVRMAVGSRGAARVHAIRPHTRLVAADIRARQRSSSKPKCDLALICPSTAAGLREMWLNSPST